MTTVGSPLLWGIFATIIVVMLAIDLFVFKSGHQHRVTLKEAAGWSIAWVCVALTFNLGFWFYLKQTQGLEIANQDAMLFLTGYLLEKSLAVDNVFVWMLIFSFFSIPPELQRRVLLYGIAGAIVLRTIMIFAGSWLISEFEWILLIFGAFLVFTGVKMVLPGEDQPDLANNRMILWLRRRYPITKRLKGEKFFIRYRGRLIATPLFLALVLVEISDIVFAVDSIPAIFALTTDPFIVLTSNLFAILGLRAMYFLLAAVGDKFELLKYGLGVILVFVGVKMLIADWYHVPVMVSLPVILGVLVVTALASVWYARYQERHQPD